MLKPYRILKVFQSSFKLLAEIYKMIRRFHLPVRLNPRILGLFLPVLLFVLTMSSSNAFAGTLRVEILPKRISPGDAFMVKIFGAETSSVPTASLGGVNFCFSTCGEGCYVSIGAVDIKTKPGTYTVKVETGEKEKTVKMIIRKKRFSEARISLPLEKVFLSPGDLGRVKEETERLGEIFRTVSDRMWDGDFILPLENSVLSRFGTKRIMNGKVTSVHRGIDIRGKEGEAVLASNSGTVVFADELFLGGKTVILDHGQEVYTLYMHLSKFNVNPFDVVSKGDVIGFVGSTGRATGPHLHFGAKVMNISTNPVSLIKLAL